MALFLVPPYAICDFLDKDDLVILMRTHSFFSLKYAKIASPQISLLYRPNDDRIIYKKILKKFPKAKLIIDTVSMTKNLTVLPRITSLDLSYSYSYAPNLPLITNLTSLCLRNCGETINTEMLTPLTKLVELDLDNNREIKGSTLQKLTLLQKLNLDNNTIITDLDIEYLPLRSLSLECNTTITPFILPKLNLTHLNIRNYGAESLSEEIIKCRTITSLDLSGNRFADIFKIIEKMTWLQKLTINERVYEKSLSYLTNLTYLEIYRNQAIEISSLVKLQTLIIRETGIFGSRYECQVSYQIKFINLKNLTHLDVSIGRLLSNPKLSKLENLKKLTLRNSIYNLDIDISHLISLTSLEIINCSMHSFVREGNISNQSLESLTVVESTTKIYDNSLAAFSNLKYLVLQPKETSRIKGRCFKDLPKLFSIKINQLVRLEDSCIPSLLKRGIMLSYCDE
ncbi:MAG: hypothetical protein Hyperionvirus2_89 [Hyperionvirus sp.]|uniref:Leucine-rich repeat protein n=1 Tax=Hyperionvirus sp. TaxID=2487770 RepID=A0A3G5A964_9VIRU|nr:MAG: hypothetical protein Hyperionvirus2_89 [Hyperionvirus sp.]